MEPTSKIIPLSIEHAFTATDFVTTSLPNITPRQVYAMKNLYSLNFKKEIELVSDIPCALFKNHVHLPPHTRINSLFNIDSNNYAGAFPTTVINNRTNPLVAITQPPTIVKMTWPMLSATNLHCAHL